MTPETICEHLEVLPNQPFRSAPFEHNPARVLRIVGSGGLSFHLLASTGRGTLDLLASQCYGSKRELIRLFDHEAGRADVPVSYVLEVRATSGSPGFVSATLF